MNRGFTLVELLVTIAVLGLLADHTSIAFVYQAIAYLPLLGVVAALLPGKSRKS